MGRNQPVKPTFPGLIFVAPGPFAEKAAQALMATAELAFSSGDVPMNGPFEGDLSEWIRDLSLKSTRVLTLHPAHEGSSDERTALLQSGEILTDAKSDAEVELMRITEHISAQDAAEIFEAFNSGDSNRVSQIKEALKAKLEDKLGSISETKIGAMKAQLMRMRAMRAHCLCALFLNAFPYQIIEKARSGDRRAVLDLVKIDKLFLSDSCTRDVIRTASLQADQAFLKQLAASLAFRPRINSKKSSRLYLYMLFALNIQIPALPILHLRLDPDGTKFKTFSAFERFVERCRHQFHEIAVLCGEGELAVPLG